MQNDYDLCRIVDFKSFVYFLVAPTLCFQLHYPRSERIRPWFLFKRIVEFMFLVSAQIYVMLQFIYPALLKSPEVFNAENFDILESANYVL